ncbi:isocitrate/isopropylmalate family dehydrogenase [Candidatus Latescibacterota bacterium]
MDKSSSQENTLHGTLHPWSDLIFDRSLSKAAPLSPYLVGVLGGEGIGPEVIAATLTVLKALESSGPDRFEVNYQDVIRSDPEPATESILSDEAAAFCQSIFSRNGAVLTGPLGGRVVYDLRKELDLFCKISPIKVYGELSAAGRMNNQYTQDVDILIIRENTSGAYQGSWRETSTSNGDRRAEHSFAYTEKEVRRILDVAAGIAQRRRGTITVICKDGGIPSISKLWRDCTIAVASETGVEYSLLNIDYAAYRLIQHAQEFDVVVAPNLFGDILSDICGVLLGSRALAYSGNFSSDRGAVYQTNHGSAHDLVGTNTANPVGQIFSLAMMLKESFGLNRQAILIERAVKEVWRQGWRTPDLEESGCRLAGTREMGDLIAEALAQLC